MAQPPAAAAAAALATVGDEGLQGAALGDGHEDDATPRPAAAAAAWGDGTPVGLRLAPTEVSTPAGFPSLATAAPGGFQHPAATAPAPAQASATSAAALAAAAVADSPVTALRHELNKVAITHEQVAEFLPALGGFLSANNPLIAAAETMGSIVEAPAEGKAGGLIHWLGEMASQEAGDIKEDSTGWLPSGLSGWGFGGGAAAAAETEPEETTSMSAEDEAHIEKLKRENIGALARAGTAGTHDPDDDIGGLEHKPLLSEVVMPRRSEPGPSAAEDMRKAAAAAEAVEAAEKEREEVQSRAAAPNASAVEVVLERPGGDNVVLSNASMCRQPDGSFVVSTTRTYSREYVYITMRHNLHLIVGLNCVNISPGVGSRPAAKTLQLTELGVKWADAAGRNMGTQGAGAATLTPAAAVAAAPTAEEHTADATWDASSKMLTPKMLTPGSLGYTGDKFAEPTSAGNVYSNVGMLTSTAPRTCTAADETQAQHRALALATSGAP